ncbi:MAG: DNA polymerase IV [Geodermatophilaceae bacterium]|nr:DNA polymerase IV [Geodermatophilaceae bacterium]
MTGSAAASCSDTSILHVDMDAFFASVEVRRRPELAGLPVIVGGAGNRGVVTSATYEARRYGVRSAMPMSRARRLCPKAVIVPGNMDAYVEVSRAIMALFAMVTPLVEPLSLDEAFLDVRGAGRRLGDPVMIGHWLRARVADEQGITCSVGVAASKFVAKLASTHAKPDGLLRVPPGEVMDFLHPLPVGALWGVGAKTEEQLTRLGLRTVGDIANTPRATLIRALGVAAGAHLYELSWGRDPRHVVPDEADRSTGAEETFESDVDDPVIIHRELLRLSERTAGNLRAGGHVARTVSIKVRFADFKTITRSKTLRQATDVGHEIYQLACELFDSLGLDRARIRLVGVRAEGLRPAADTPEQMLLGAPERGWREAEIASDAAAVRFGRGAVRPAALVRRQHPGPPKGTEQPRQT